jgi:hypothetical protein
LHEATKEEYLKSGAEIHFFQWWVSSRKSFFSDETQIGCFWPFWIKISGKLPIYHKSGCGSLPHHPTEIFPQHQDGQKRPCSINL